MPLNKQIFEATRNGNLSEPFTVHYLKKWMERYKIVKDDGKEYAESSINAMLSNSDRKNNPTTNKNIKPLQSRINDEGKSEYWF
jgi:hypothetical protein